MNSISVIPINSLTFFCHNAPATEIACWMYTSQRQMTGMQMAYLTSVLSQDIGAFDTDLTTATIMAFFPSDGSLYVQLLHILSCCHYCLCVLLGGGYDGIFGSSDAPRGWSNICENDGWHVDDKDSFGL